MKILTRDFGEMEIQESDIVEFRLPVFGFEELKRFVFLFQPEASEHFGWLQSVEEPDICFFVVDPVVVDPQYAPELPREVERALEGDRFMCWLIMVVREDIRSSTVNLKSPIVVNPEKKLAGQVILDQDYPIRLPIGPQGEEIPPC